MSYIYNLIRHKILPPPTVLIKYDGGNIEFERKDNRMVGRQVFLCLYFISIKYNRENIRVAKIVS